MNFKPQRSKSTSTVALAPSARRMSFEPEPNRVGVLTTGPSCSCHRKLHTHRSPDPLTTHAISTKPDATDSAPCLMALVASSCSTKDRPRASRGFKSTAGPKMRTADCCNANGSKARSTTSFTWVVSVLPSNNNRCAPAIEDSRFSSASAAALRLVAVSNVCLVTARTIENTFDSR